MKQFFGIVAINTLSIICLGITAYMIYADKDYWGWVLVVALICAKAPKSIDV
jgi:hypothetical protein